MSTALNGASYFFRGLRILFRPRILPFLLFPIVINSAIYYFGFNLVYENFSDALQLWIDKLPDFLTFLAPLLKAIFLALLIAIAALTFSSVATIIGAPFYGFLAEQVVLLTTGIAPDQPLIWVTFLKSVPLALVRELRKLAYYLPRAISLAALSLLCLFFFTALQPVVSVFWLLFGARMLSIQYTDYAFDNDRKSFQTMRKSLKQHRTLALGFGATTQFALMIPILSIIFIPAAVCGATILYCEKLSSREN